MHDGCNARTWVARRRRRRRAEWQVPAGTARRRRAPTAGQARPRRPPSSRPCCPRRSPSCSRRMQTSRLARAHNVIALHTWGDRVLPARRARRGRRSATCRSGARGRRMLLFEEITAPSGRRPTPTRPPPGRPAQPRVDARHGQLAGSLTRARLATPIVEIEWDAARRAHVPALPVGDRGRRHDCQRRPAVARGNSSSPTTA